MNPRTLKHIKTSLVGYFPKKNYDFEAFAKETAIYIDLFQHVFNSELDESNSFKSFVENMTDEQLANIDYVRVRQNEIKRLPKPIKSAKSRELKSAFKRCIASNANQNDKLNFFFKIWIKRRSNGRPRKRFDRLELKCFAMLV